MQPFPSLSDRFAIGVDVKNYSGRKVRHQLVVQRVVDEMLSSSATAAELDRELWERQPGGDGEVAVLPADVDLLAVLTTFVHTLDRLLTDHNEDRPEDLRIRLRVAMHIGTVTPGTLGSGGQALIELSRLLDCEPVRRALSDHPGANLALILSEEVYRKVVLTELGGLRPRQFTEVRIDIPAKAYRATAFVHVPGEQPAGSTPDAPDPPPGDGPRKAVYNVFNKRLDLTNPVFGFNEGD